MATSLDKVQPAQENPRSQHQADAYSTAIHKNTSGPAAFVHHTTYSGWQYMLTMQRALSDSWRTIAETQVQLRLQATNF
jgi:hypothetical protein